MKNLSIDLETRSSVDIGKCGVYRYAESPDFDILLFGVSIDHGPVMVYDLANGDTVPEGILKALTDQNVEKWAYNSSFERICLSIWLKRKHPRFFLSRDGKYLDPGAWKCSMVLGAYNGLPFGLEKIGAVLGFEEQKLKEGKDLIRYFCVPSRSADRAWNLPEHAPEKWELFKKYNERDVQVELQIQERLSKYPVPESVWEEYHIDQEINDRGIRIDRELVTQAIRMDELSKAELTKQLKQLTGLENPNSVAQLKQYLADQWIEIESLGKKEAAELIKTAPEEIGKVLSLRLQIAKSSVKKFQAMANCMCEDGRCRGLFQFYSASRTGRWAGRLIQLQNLPQNHLPDLEQARELVRAGDYEMLSLLYPSVPAVLSELIRTAFIPEDGMKFIVSDYSAVEARALSFLAGEQWRMEVFHSGGDIYCKSASAMFKVPVEKHGQNAHLRQKGKIAELACIAEGQLVLTNHGEKPIETITTDDLLWDGTEWVRHDGVIRKGIREVITYDGLTATPDHLVWIEGQAEPVQFGIAAARGARLLQTGNGGTAIRLGDNHQPGETVEPDTEPLLRADPVRGLRHDPMAVSQQSAARKIERLPGLLPAPADPSLAGQETDRGQTTVRESQGSGISELRGPGNPVPVSQRAGSGPVSAEDVWNARPENGIGPDRHERALRTGECAPRDQNGKPGEQADHGAERIQAGILAVLLPDNDPETEPGTEPGRDHPGRGNSGVRKEKELAANPHAARVYDVRNAGQHHRFTVSGRLVHNCGYGGSVGALKAMGAVDMGIPEEELKPLVDAWRQANPKIVEYWWQVDEAVKAAIKTGIPQKVGHIRFEMKSGVLFIILPSGRKLAYIKPRIEPNQFGGESITYMGTNAQKHWSRIESYGPKIVENIVQAVCRELLAETMKRIENSEFRIQNSELKNPECRIVAHVHDEVIIEAPEDMPVETITDVMGQTPEWIRGLELRGDGFAASFYRKD